MSQIMLSHALRHPASWQIFDVRQNSKIMKHSPFSDLESFRNDAAYDYLPNITVSTKADKFEAEARLIIEKGVFRIALNESVASAIFYTVMLAFLSSAEIKAGDLIESVTSVTIITIFTFVFSFIRCQRTLKKYRVNKK